MINIDSPFAEKVYLSKDVCYSRTRVVYPSGYSEVLDSKLRHVKDDGELIELAVNTILRPDAKNIREFQCSGCSELIVLPYEIVEQ